MASIKLYQKPGKGKTHHPLYLRITHNRKSRLVNLDIRISEDDWNAKQQKVRKTHPNYKWLNNFLKGKRAEAQQEILKVREKSKNGVTADILKQAVEGSWQDLTDFFTFAEDIIADFEKRGKYRRKRNYKVVMGRMREFWGKDKLPFSNIDVTFLRKFNVYLETEYGNKPNTRGNYLKKVRKIFNDAIREEHIDRSLYPFNKFTIPSEKSYKTKLLYDQIKDLEGAKLKKGQRRWDSRNMFVFAFYARGMRFRDILQLTWGKVKNGRLRYIMEKTGHLVDMELLPQMNDILDHYRPEEEKPDPEDYVFPFFQKEKDYTDKKFFENQVSSKNSLVNGKIKEVAKKVDIEENVSFHVARHSFAYHCLKEGKDVYTIKDLLGHEDIRATMQYLKSLGTAHLDDEVANIF